MEAVAENKKSKKAFFGPIHQTCLIVHIALSGLGREKHVHSAFYKTFMKDMELRYCTEAIPYKMHAYMI